jgi:hypothetical protein
VLEEDQSASNGSCLHFVGFAVITSRPKNIRIHLAESRVRFYPFRFNSSGNFCDGDAIYKEIPFPIRTTRFRTCGIGQGSVAKLREDLLSLQVSHVRGLWPDDGQFGT